MDSKQLMEEFLACKYDTTKLDALWANKRVAYAQLTPAQVFENINNFVDNFNDNSMVENGVFFNDSFRYTRDINPGLIKQEANKGKPFEPTPDLIDLAADAVEKGGPEVAPLALQLAVKLIQKADSAANFSGNLLARVIDLAGFTVLKYPHMKDEFVKEIENTRVVKDVKVEASDGTTQVIPQSFPKIPELDTGYSGIIASREIMTVSGEINKRVKDFAPMLQQPYKPKSSSP